MACIMFKEIEEAIKEAMKSHDNVKRDCLRSVMSEVKNLTINAGKEITDDICLKVLQKSVKTHNDSIEQFSSAGRNDLVEKEKAEVAILSSFLPSMMSNEEVEAFAKDVIMQLSSQFGRDLSKKDMGLVMKAIKEHKDASRVDMKAASKVVASLLK